MKARTVLSCLASAAICLSATGCVGGPGMWLGEYARTVVDCTVNGKPAHVQRQYCDEGWEKK
jgi:hypothetical protein